MLSVLSLRAFDTGQGTDWTQLGYAVIITFGVCFTAVYSYKGVKAGQAAKEAAAESRAEALRTAELNTLDHGRVIDALEANRAELIELRAAVLNVGQNVGTLRDQFITHLRDHIRENP